MFFAPGMAPLRATTPLFASPLNCDSGRASIRATPLACALATSSADARSSGRKLALKATLVGTTASFDTAFPAASQARWPPSRMVTASWPSTLKVQYTRVAAPKSELFCPAGTTTTCLSLSMPSAPIRAEITSTGGSIPTTLSTFARQPNLP